MHFKSVAEGWLYCPCERLGGWAEPGCEGRWCQSPGQTGVNILMGQLWVEARPSHDMTSTTVLGPIEYLQNLLPTPTPCWVALPPPSPMTPSPQGLARPPAGVSCPFIQEALPPSSPGSGSSTALERENLTVLLSTNSSQTIGTEPGWCAGLWRGGWLEGGPW